MFSVVDLFITKNITCHQIKFSEFAIPSLCLPGCYSSLLLDGNASRIVVSGVVTLLAICYAFYIFQAMGADDFSSFGSLEGVMALFTNPIAVLAGWIHYLAFDLMVGWFIVFDSRRKNINRFLIIPCLLLSFMLGPVGLLLYLALRFLITRKYFVDFD